MPKMKPFLAVFLCSTFAACAPLIGSHTAIYYPSGHLAFETNADASGLSVNILGVGSMGALTNTHSTAIHARGDAYSQFVTAAGAAVGNGAKTFVKP